MAAFEAEMSHAMADKQARLLIASERAFEHLIRSIAVDPDIRGKWQGAFALGERACERLGAIHLLMHGIWAFKVSAPGSETDLVYNEKLSLDARLMGAVEGLVLTEWKVAKSEKDALLKLEQARAQAKNYASGALGGGLLQGTRFLPVVTGEQAQLPDDVEDGGVLYRQICIPVSPLSASVAARAMR